MSDTKKIVIGIISLLLVGILFFITTKSKTQPPVEETTVKEILPSTIETTPTTTKQVIGTSVENRNIEAYTFGTGENDLLFVGGIHGGYEWNSILLAYEMIDYFSTNYEAIPKNVTIHIIPALNPDGLFAATGLEGRFVKTDITSYEMHTTGEGRFNANKVDLNRNFACKWAPESTWRGLVVSAGTAAFSEPEAQALKNYVTKTTPESVVMWHSKANNVYASECENGVLPKTLSLMNAYAIAGDYGAVPVFDAYPITGDAEGWLASIGIPAITVELETRTSPEWERNIAGVNALLYMYGK